MQSVDASLFHDASCSNALFNVGLGFALQQQACADCSFAGAHVGRVRAVMSLTRGGIILWWVQPRDQCRPSAVTTAKLAWGYVQCEAASQSQRR